MTETEAKELLIGGMNYAAYKETGHSLWDSDMNKLFGEEHLRIRQTCLSGERWGDGEEFEKKMATLLRWAVQLGSALGSYPEAIRVLSSGEHYLNHIIRRADLHSQLLT